MKRLGKRQWQSKIWGEAECFVFNEQRYLVWNTASRSTKRQNKLEIFGGMAFFASGEKAPGHEHLVLSLPLKGALLGLHVIRLFCTTASYVIHALALGLAQWLPTFFDTFLPLLSSELFIPPVIHKFCRATERVKTSCLR